MNEEDFDKCISSLASNKNLPWLSKLICAFLLPLTKLTLILLSDSTSKELELKLRGSMGVIIMLFTLG